MKRIALALVLAPLLVSAGCSSWEQTRDELVTPVNKLVHSDYPRLLREGDIEGLTALYTPEAAVRAISENARLLAPLERVERAVCVIYSIEDASDDELVLSCRLSLRGPAKVEPGQVSYALGVEERMTITCRLTDEGWRIADSKRTSAWLVKDDDGPRFQRKPDVGVVQRSRGVANANGEPVPYMIGSGLALADVDGDGWTDALFTTGSGLRLLRNQRGQLIEATEASGLTAGEAGELRLAVFGDIDGDGDLDLFVAVYEAPHRLFINDGRGRFTLADGAARGLQGGGHPSGAVFLDADRDGDLDLFVAHGQNVLRIGPTPVYEAKNANPCRLYINDGEGNFREEAEARGAADRGWALACTAADLDDDGDVDILIANDFGPDCMLVNDGSGNFEDKAEQAGLSFPGSSMGVATGDVNGDGRLDILVSGMNSNSRWILDLPLFPAPAPWPVRWVFRSAVLDVMRHMLHGNRLYLANGDGTYRDVSDASNSRESGWAWGGLIGDLDNDGRSDCYVLNGFLSGEDRFDC